MSIWTRDEVVQFFTGRMTARASFAGVRFRCFIRPKYEQSEVWLLEKPAGKATKNLYTHTQTLQHPHSNVSKSPSQSLKCNLKTHQAEREKLEPSERTWLFDSSPPEQTLLNCKAVLHQQLSAEETSIDLINRCQTVRKLLFASVVCC